MKEQAFPQNDFIQYSGLEQFPDALSYLQHIGVSAADLTSIYPTFEEYAESEFDNFGIAFRYFAGSYEKSRLDRVLFPSPTDYPYILAVDRQERYMPPHKNSVGVYTLPKRRIRLNIYPDDSITLQLQQATEEHLTNMATYFIDPDGNVSTSDLAMKNGEDLNTRRKYKEGYIPEHIGQMSAAEAHKIMYFSEEFLEEGWGLAEKDIAIPSAKLTRKIITAPVAKGIDLKEMLN